MATETKSSVVRVKPSHQDGSSKAKVDSSSANKKKIESSNKQPVDSKQKSVTSVVKTEVKSKTASASAKTTTKTTTKVKSKTASASASAKTTKTTTRVREKKVYTLPGQKYDPPEEREPLRIFYESLSQQIPTSEMAEFCCYRMMEHGLLSPERAKKAYEKKQRRQKQLRMGTPIKSLKPTSRPESSQKQQQQQQQASKNGILKAKKRIINDSDDDDDFILSAKRRKG